MSLQNTPAAPVELATQVELVEQLAHTLKARQLLMATAESCTGGMVAARCTDLAGSSEWFERGFVTYSNLAKTQMLGVAPALLQAHGAVSEPVARAMAQGAVQHSGAHCALAITGIAGPSGGSADKPVGLVWFGWCVPASGQTLGQLPCQERGQTHSVHRIFPGERAAVRQAATQFALAELLRLLQGS